MAKEDFYDTSILDEFEASKKPIEPRTPFFPKAKNKFGYGLISLALLILSAIVIKSRIDPHNFIPLNGHKGKITGVAFSSDGETVASASADGTIRLWKTKSGDLLRTVAASNKPVLSVALSPTSQVLASCDGEDTIKLWDTQSGSSLDKLEGGYDSRLTNLVFSPDGKSLASGSNWGSVRLWNIQTLEESRHYSDFATPCTSIAYSKDGRWFANAAPEGITLHDTANASSQRYIGGGGSYLSVSFSPDGNILASGVIDLVMESKEGKVHAFPDFPGTKSGQTKKHSRIDIWDVQSGKTIVSQPTSSPILSLAFSPDGNYVATGEEDHSIRLRNSHTLAVVKEIREFTSSVNAIAFSPDGSLIAGGCSDGSLNLWHIK